MPYIRLSVGARQDLARLYRFLAQHSVHSADKATDAIFHALGILEGMPLIGPAVPQTKRLRKLVIPFGATGYVACYHYDPSSDICTIVRIFHQREQISWNLLDTV